MSTEPKKVYARHARELVCSESIWHTLLHTRGYAVALNDPEVKERLREKT
jgi:rRNA-processing protein FCF1